MNKNDWYEAGDQIKRLVQDAVDSGDFSQLGNTISNVVNDTMDGLQSVLKENLTNTQKADQKEYKYREVRYTHDRKGYSDHEAADRIRRNLQEQRERHIKSKDQIYRPVKAKRKAPGEIIGQILKWTGYSFGGMFGLSLGIVGVVSLTSGFMMELPMGILAFLFASSMYVGIKGSRKVSLAKRFRRYREVLGERTYCLVEELASAIGQDCKFVQKDLKKMIRRGFFKSGYLDRKETMLITDQATYQQYLQTQTEYERKVQAEEWKRNSARAAGHTEEKTTEKAASDKQDLNKQDPLSKECRELIEEGKSYIQYVRECNDRIPGETMSAKLDRLELLITKIFHEAEKNPDIAADLKKMMSYYLPTTKKLLDTYCELDRQPIRGQNIENTKKEIENALDTVNTAFENLLDSFFEETAWDISSDISVLNTMFAQEGLTGNDFQSR